MNTFADVRLLVTGAILVAALAVFLGSTAGAATEQAASPRTWQPLPPAPIAGRLDASVVWTGREMIVWGGVTRPPIGHGQARPDSDGAAYSPTANAWRTIARPPSGLLGGGGRAAAWTGHQMVLWVGNSPEGPAGAATYDPIKNSWTRLPRGPLGVREEYVSAWTGKELLIFGGHAGDSAAQPTAAALSPGTRSWRTLRALDVLHGLIPNGAVWDGREAFVSGRLHRRGASDRPILFSFSARSGLLRRLNLTKAPVQPRQRSQLDPVAWTGTEVLFSTSADPLASSSGVVLYNPATGRWRKARRAPCALPAATYTQIAWIGRRLVVACASSSLQLYSPRTNSWQVIHPGRSPLNSRSSSALAWSGAELIVWSGTTRTPGNPTPADGASLTLSG